MSNLLPYNEQQHIVHMYHARFATVAIFALGALLVFASALIVPSLLLSRGTEAAIIARRDALAGRETNTIEKNLTQTVDDINTRLAVFRPTLPNSPLLQSFLEPVLDAKTPSIQIAQMGFTTDPKKPGVAAISISGVANTREALLDYAAKLRGIDGVHDVLVPIESFLKGSNESFTISATVDLK